MNETRTADILQRVPAILAVTANSYGLILQAGGSRKPQSAGERRGPTGCKSGGKPAGQA
jgi:hypothetical protein